MKRWFAIHFKNRPTLLIQNNNQIIENTLIGYIQICKNQSNSDSLASDAFTALGKSCQLSVWFSVRNLILPCLCCGQDDPMTNLNTAFDVAEKYLDIPKMLDAEGEQWHSVKVVRKSRLFCFWVCSCGFKYFLPQLQVWKNGQSNNISFCDVAHDPHIWYQVVSIGLWQWCL